MEMLIPYCCYLFAFEDSFLDDTLHACSRYFNILLSRAVWFDPLTLEMKVE